MAAVQKDLLLSGIAGIYPSHVARAISSVGEHYLDMVGVTGSIPVSPTIGRDRINA